MEASLTVVLDALEQASTQVARDYFGRSMILPSNSHVLYELLERLQKNMAAAAATRNDSEPAAVVAEVHANANKRDYATMIVEAEEAAPSMILVSERPAAVVEHLQHELSASMPAFDKARALIQPECHTTVGFKRPWITMANNGHARTVHFTNADELRRCWAHALCQLIQTHGSATFDSGVVNVPQTIRFELALHMLECGDAGRFVLEELRLFQFIAERFDTAPWYGQYVNQFMHMTPLPSRLWPYALAQCMSGYPISVMALLMFVQARGTTTATITGKSDMPLLCPHLMVSTLDIEEFASLLRLQHSATMRRFADEQYALRELTTLIDALQAHFGVSNAADRADYARHFMLDQSHSMRFHQAVRKPMQNILSDTSDERTKEAAVSLTRLAINIRQRLRDYYPKDNLSVSLPRLYTRLGACSSSNTMDGGGSAVVNIVEVELYTLMQWFAQVGRWAVVTHLLLLSLDNDADAEQKQQQQQQQHHQRVLGVRSFPRARMLSLFKTCARVEGTLGEHCVDRWLVVSSPFHVDECLLIATLHFWSRFQVNQSFMYLSAHRLPGMLRSRHADVFQIVRALLCGDDFTVCSLFANVLISYMTIINSQVPFALMRGRCNYFRRLPHVLQRVFGSANAFVDAFHDSTLYVPKDQSLLDRATGQWTGLPERWFFAHSIPGYAHYPHMYYALLSYLSPHRCRWIHLRTMTDVRRELIARGVCHKFGTLGSRNATMVPFEDGSPDERFYSHVEHWMAESMDVAFRSGSDWVPLYDDTMKYPPNVQLDAEIDGPLTIGECWYQLCCDEAALSLDTRMRMFMLVRLDGPIVFPDQHHNVLTTDCRSPDEWVESILGAAAFGTTSAEQILTNMEEDRLLCMHDYFLRCRRRAPTADLEFWVPRDLRVAPIYNRTTLEIIVTLVCLLRDGMLHKVPAPHVRDTCPYPTTMVPWLTDVELQKRESKLTEEPRLAALTGGNTATRFTAMACRRNKYAASWARRFGIMFMSELRQLLGDSSVLPPMGMAYKARDVAPERIGSESIVLVNDDMIQYSAHPDSPANAPDNALLAEAGMFTRYQRNDMRRRILDGLNEHEKEALRCCTRTTHATHRTR